MENMKPSESEEKYTKHIQKDKGVMLSAKNQQPHEQLNELRDGGRPDCDKSR